MNRTRYQRHSGKSGQAPGTLIHVGRKRTEKTKIVAIDFDALRIQESITPTLSELSNFKSGSANVWVSIEGLHEIELINSIGDCFQIHSLVKEDILNTTQRPKIENFDDYLFIVMKMLDYDDKAEAINSQQISLVVGANFLLSFQEGVDDPFDPLRQRIRAESSRLRMSGTDYLAYCMVDIIVDNYFVVLDKLAERIELVEEELVRNPKPDILRVIHKLKTDLIFLRRSVWPLREIINRLINEDSSLFKDSTRPYLRDVFDHTIHAVDTIETFRDIVSGMLDIYLSSVSYKLNEIMKVLTIIATIFIPLTFLAGWYGMNFKNMPEIDSPWGYPLVIVAAIIITFSMLIFFRRKKWI